MIRFAAKRGLLVALMLLGLLAITFTISHVAPADPAALAAGPDATLEMIERHRVEHGLDRPLPEQFAIYLRDLLTGDWGRSIHTTRAVWDDLVTYFPNTFELVVFSIAIAIVFGVPLGVVAAVRQNRPLDHVIRVVTVSGVAMPMFWLGLMAQPLLRPAARVVPPGRADRDDDRPARAHHPPAAARRPGSGGSSGPSPKGSTTSCCPRWRSASPPSPPSSG